MTNDFRSYNVIYIVYDRKNENHWSLLVTHYSLLGIQTPHSSYNKTPTQALTPPAEKIGKRLTYV